jgi:glutathione peroxidase
MNESIHGFSVRDIQGRERNLGEWKGQVLLVVNVASKCGFTPQYAGLQKLHSDHAGQGFSVLGFPCDQFGHQEPGDEAEILNFCRTQYDVDFPLFEKLHVNGVDAHPMYVWLCAKAPGLLGSKGVKWNFTKFLIDREGRPVRRFAPSTAPERIEDDIVELLEA